MSETCWACEHIPSTDPTSGTNDVPEGDIALCDRHWNWWVVRWLGAADEPPCWAHHMIGEEATS